MAYTPDDLWDAIKVLAPESNFERDALHIIPMVIPGLIATEAASKKYDNTRTIDIGRNIAYMTLLKAYWDLIRYGHYHHIRKDR